MMKATKLTPYRWALVVFGNVRAEDVVFSRGRFVYESARAFYFKETIRGRIIISNE